MKNPFIFAKIILLSLGIFASLDLEATNSDVVITNSAGSTNIRIIACKEYAGAICSLRWNNKEFVNNHDHGRQIQSAANFRFPLSSPRSNIGDGSDFPETYNPTEAGNNRDRGR